MRIVCPKCGSTDIISPTEKYPLYTCDPCGHDFMPISIMKINEYKSNPKKAIKQLESCHYKCEGGNLENNLAFIALKEIFV